MNKYPYEPFDRAIPVPTGAPNSAPFVCVRFSRKWLPHVLGALGALLQQRAYAGTEVQKILATRQAMNLITLFMKNECGEMAIDDIRLTDCILEYHMDGEWYTVGNITDCSAEALAAAQAAQTAAENAQNTANTALSNAPVVTPPSTNATNDTTQKVACAVADFTITYIMDKWNDFLDQLKAGLIAAAAVARIVADLVNMVAQFTVIGDEAIDAVNEVVIGTTETIVQELQAQDTVEWRSAMKCHLYELLKPTSGSFGDTRSVVVDPMTQWIFDHSDMPQKSFLTIFWGLLAIQTFQRLSRIAQNNEGECDDCEVEWCHEFDFTTGEHGWTIDTYGAYVAGVGFVATAAGGGKSLLLDHSFSPVVNLNSVRATLVSSLAGSGNFDAYAEHGAHLTLWPDTNPVSGDYSYSAGVSNVSFIRIHPSANGSSSTITVTKIRLTGYGVNPFGEDNCA